MINDFEWESKCNMKEKYKILDEKEMSELITVSECRKLREAIQILTVAPLITKGEYVRLMVVINGILDRMEKEDAETVD